MEKNIDTSKRMPCPGDFKLDAFFDFLEIPFEYRNFQRINIEEDPMIISIRNQEELESFEKEYK